MDDSVYDDKVMPRLKAIVNLLLTYYKDFTRLVRPEQNLFAPRSVRRALLMPQVNTGSLYRCGKRT